MHERGRQTQHGKPHYVVEREINRTPARDRSGVMGWRRPVVPMKSGNADGGKGPWFKTNATSGKGQEIGNPENSGKCPETADGVTCQSEGRTRFSLLPPIRQGISTGRTRIRLSKLQNQQGSSRGRW